MMVVIMMVMVRVRVNNEHDEYRTKDPLYLSLVGLEDLKVVAVMVSMVNMLGTVQCTSQNEDPLHR